MNKKSLVYKLIVTFTGTLAFITVLIAIVLSTWYRANFFKQKKEILDKQSVIISEMTISYVNVDKTSDLKKLNQVLSIVSSSIDADILITDNLGIAYAFSNDEIKDMQASSIGIPEGDMEKLRNGESVEHGRGSRFSFSKHTYLKPIFNGDYFMGVIVMTTSEENIRNELGKVYELVWLLVFIGIILAGGIIYYFSKRLIVNPLAKLNSAANKLAKGDVKQRVEVISDDEIGELSTSFNIMAESLEKVEKNRNDFISNVSHELRSPITSMKGFVAGILDGVIPKDRENYYLNIVHDEIKRLSRLVDELLDISSMEDGKFKLNKIEIDINTLIKICLANLETKIINKNLDVEVVLEDEHKFVYADRDRIIQVITNLVDNAIKYTDDGGKIKVTTKSKGSKVYVSIFNSGSQMTDEQIIHIWDRFYKADKSRTNKESTGLGLPIVRLILSQHGEEIWVKNEKDGVRFTFTLKSI